MSSGMKSYELAKFMHETYEHLAPQFGYKTRPESAVPWAEVPQPNKTLMINVAGEVIRKLNSEREPRA